MIEYLPAEYKELLLNLNRLEVSYLLIGGIAVNIYGYSRATRDLDILYENSDKNILRLKNAIESLGYDLSGLDHDFSKPTHLRLGEPPISIDILNDTAGLDFSNIFNKAKNYQFEDIPIRVIHIEDLILNKKALNTFKDLADAEALERIKKIGRRD
ncbi:MAG: nucleotidyltransferase [Bacteroidetes bacterium]|nr:nucleotidyltransferase [Bacteroidota bacterium]MDA1119698.1 nucleotidyltransferase [Bacteroidota bacterium]